MDSEIHTETTTLMGSLQPYILSLLQSQDISVRLGKGVYNAIEGELTNFLVIISNKLAKYLTENERSCAKITDIMAVLKTIYTDTYIYEKKIGKHQRTYLPLVRCRHIITVMHPEMTITKQGIEYVRFVAEIFLIQLFNFMLPSLEKVLEMEHLNDALSKMKELELSP